jgi:DNA-binding transcriptional LysR family regulator
MNTLDYSHLPALKLLLTEKSVSRAAELMSLSQPAMSRIFTKLKKALNDPLMIRAGNRYELTSRAQTILQELNHLLPQLESLSQEDEFDLSEVQQTLDVAGTDMDIVYVSEQITQIQKQAPNLQIAIRANRLRILDDVISGEIDFALTVSDDERAGLYRKTLTKEKFVVVAGANNPITMKELTLSKYLAQKHGKFSFVESTRGHVDAALEQMGLRRNISISLPTFLQIPPFLSETELLFSVPESFAVYLRKHFKIKILPLPFSTRQLEIYLYWHERQHQNKLHQWIRGKLLQKKI